MNENDQVFLQRLRAMFKTEAEEHIQFISNGLLKMEQMLGKEPSPEVVEGVFRSAHSLKGASHSVNLTEVEAVCQEIEGLIAAWKRRELTPNQEQLDILNKAIDFIRGGLPDADGLSVSLSRSGFHEIKKQLQEASGNGKRGRSFESMARSRLVGGDQAHPNGPNRTRPNVVGTGSKSNPSLGQSLKIAHDVGGAEPTPQPRSADFQANNINPLTGAASTVRVSTEKLEHHYSESEELLMVKEATHRRVCEWNEMQCLIQDWKTRLKSLDSHNVNSNAQDGRPGLQSSTGLESGFILSNAQAEYVEWCRGFISVMEFKVQQCSTAALRDDAQVSKRVDGLIENSKRLLMLPFSTVLDFFPKMLRDLCREQDKQAELMVAGDSIEIDKRILERMQAPLVHLLRNCVDHGLEKAEARERLGKPPLGRIEVCISRTAAGKIEIRMSDDGQGVDLSRLKTVCLEKGVITAEEASRLDDHQLLQWVFKSEISTSPNLTEISGRGLGLAIVKEHAEELGGEVMVESRPQAGTTFRILLPTLLAAFRGLVVLSGGGRFIVPSQQVVRIVRFDREEIKPIENTPTISRGGITLPLVELDELLGCEPTNSKTEKDGIIYALVIESDQKKFAFIVEDVIDEREILVKPLPQPLIRLCHVSGIAVLESGHPVLVLNPADLVKTACRFKNPIPNREPAGPDTRREGQAKRVLVAEDSMTSRMLLKSILESAGHKVKTVVDGVEAIAELRTQPYDVLVSDVEMPRMNGFDLTAQVRGEPDWANLPVILVTALASDNDRKRGVDAGADAYILKGQFDQKTLLQTIERLTI